MSLGRLKSADPAIKALQRQASLCSVENVDVHPLIIGTLATCDNSHQYLRHARECGHLGRKNMITEAWVAACAAMTDFRECRVGQGKLV